ncbi:type I toxin-antitoxin system Hok family toxin [Salmonella enterica]|nr:type I toxin-antitoxin system Hok family toxin [Salmonella enterica]
MKSVALYGLIVVCITILCFSLIHRDRLCSVSMKNGSTVISATLSYEDK